MNNKVKDNIKIPRPEFPRPDRFRSDWINLNGYWRFSFEEPPKADSREILVPFAWQSTLSGIADEENHPIGWYERSFTIPVEYEGKRIFIHFGAVDYKAEVWVNGLFVGEHEGGYTPFSFDITGIVQAVGRENILTVKVVDRTDPAQPRGKQAWTEHPDRCWYVPSSGIWQSVWIEAVGKIAIERFFITPDIDRRLIDIELELDGLVSDLILETTIFFQGIQVVSHSTQLDSKRCRVVLPVREADYVDEIHQWTPENPWLYDIVFTLFESDSQLDRIQSYFAMRSIRSSGGKIWLNNRPLYQRLVLDQGYWKESLLTAPDDQAFVRDITMIKKLGFNGVRMHQKIEDPRFYYWADKLGLLVWAELPSAYEFCRYEIENLNRDFLHFLSRDYNHPSIIVWVPFNESWGIRNVMTDARQQAVVKAFYWIAKAWDPIRLISGNDGWEWVKSDVLGLHDYESDADRMYEKLKNFDSLLEGSYDGKRKMIADGESYSGEPLLVTEFGGVSFAGSGGWGYAEAVSDDNTFLARISACIRALERSSRVSGWCYTQLTDVFQETNGLLDVERNCKVPLARLVCALRGEEFIK